MWFLPVLLTSYMQWMLNLSTKLDVSYYFTLGTLMAESWFVFGAQNNLS
jgi:hypothetical protein